MVINAFKRAIKQLYPKRASIKQLEQELIKQEAAIGASIFGELPAGQVRKFYYLNEKTVIWYESLGPDSQPLNTRYEVYEDRIIKNQDGKQELVSEAEGISLLQAVRWYHYLVRTKLYNQPA